MSTAMAVLPPGVVDELLANRKRAVDWQEDPTQVASGGAGNAFKRCRPTSVALTNTSASAPGSAANPFDTWFRSMQAARTNVMNEYTPPCTAQRRDLNQTSNTLRFDPSHCQAQNRRWASDPLDEVKYTARHMNLLTQQKDQEIQGVSQRKDQENANTTERNKTLMKGVLQLHQQLEQLKAVGNQKDQILNRFVLKVQELETANLQLRQTLHQIAGGAPRCGGGFDQAPPPPPAVF